MSEPPFDSSRMSNGSQTSDLMNRLQAFLPKMQAANQALSADDGVRVDLDLQSENDDDDSDDDSVESSNEKNDESENSKATANPTIQLQFALGDMKENPLMEVLAQNDDEEDDDSSDNDSDDELNGTSSLKHEKHKAVTKLLRETSQSKKHDVNGPDTSIIFPGAASKKSGKKPLITEL